MECQFVRNTTGPHLQLFTSWNAIEQIHLPTLRPASNPTVNRTQSRNTLGAINSHSLGQFFTEKLGPNTPHNYHTERINTYTSPHVRAQL
jgi:hypothetical protein